jgi:hypothetical protein
MNEVDAGRQDTAKEEKEEAEEDEGYSEQRRRRVAEEEKSGCKNSESGESTTQSAGGVRGGRTTDKVTGSGWNEPRRYPDYAERPHVVLSREGGSTSLGLGDAARP